VTYKENPRILAEGIKLLLFRYMSHGHGAPYSEPIAYNVAVRIYVLSTFCLTGYHESTQNGILSIEVAQFPDKTENLATHAKGKCPAMQVLVSFCE
jgi:hypothetical protein